jgi:hypothetical protein
MTLDILPREAAPLVVDAWGDLQATSNTTLSRSGGTAVITARGLASGELVGTSIRPQYGAWNNVVILTLDDWSFADWHRAFGPTLVDNALVQRLVVESRATTVPQHVRIYWHKLRPGPAHRLPASTTSAAQSLAQSLLSEVQSLSGLTLEEIAPLLGVSRRSLQNWRAQRPISARKEQRLRHLADTLRSLPVGGAGNARRILLDRKPGRVRPYDLLGEGRFDVAYTTITGAAAPAHLAAFSTHPLLPPTVPVLARLSNRDDDSPSSRGRVDLRRSRRLKR